MGDRANADICDAEYTVSGPLIPLFNGLRSGA